MIDITPEDLIEEVDAITDRLNAHHLRLAKEKLKAKELIEAKHDLLDTAERLGETLRRLRTGIRMSAQSWSGLDPV